MGDINQWEDPCATLIYFMMNRNICEKNINIVSFYYHILNDNIMPHGHPVTMPARDWLKKLT